MSDTVTIDREALRGLRAGFNGALLTPTDEGYDLARRIWNGSVDKRPALVARCTGVKDVQAAVRFAREQDLPVSVRGGGHQVAGHAVVDAGVMIDLSLMRAVRVDPETKVARADGGCLLGDVDRATQMYGLATPLGVVSLTGVGGLTLGGGIGWLMGKHGFTVDNVRSIDLVTAEGGTMTVDEERDAELFWGLRGGGGNFGIATGFEYELHPAGPMVLAGPIAWPIEQAGEALRAIHTFMTDPPDEAGAVAVVRLAPPLPFVPPPLIGKPVLLAVLVWVGDPDEGAKALGPVRSTGTPAADAIRPIPFLMLQSMFDAGAPSGMGYYLKSNLLRTLPDAAIELFLEHVTTITSPLSQIRLHWINGAAKRIDPDATATTGRDAAVDVNFTSGWPPIAPSAEPHIAWAREGWQKLQPHTSGILPQFVADEADDGADEVYGEKFARLAALKRRWDPTNLFRLNQNVPPA